VRGHPPGDRQVWPGGSATGVGVTVPTLGTALVAAGGIGALAGTTMAVAVAATVQLAAGFGFGLAAVPLLSIVLSPHEAVVVSLTLATLTNTGQAWAGRRVTDRRVAGRLLTGAVVGLPIGLGLFLRLDDAVLGAVIGVAVLVAVVVIALGLDLHHAGPGLDLAGGLVAGCLTMSSGVNGPPLVFVLQARHFDQARFRATVTTVFVALDLISVVVFTLTGDLNSDTLTAVVAAMPGLAIGAVAGIALRRHLDGRRFRAMVLVLLTVAGLSALAAALVG
jgi:uncharacterized protein